MRKIILVFLFSFLAISSRAQILRQGGKILTDSIATNASKLVGTTPTIQNGSGSLGQIYNNTECGLNYVQSSVMLTTRYSPPGVGLPATLNVSSVPCNSQIVKAYIWWTTSGASTIGSVTLTNPLGIPLVYPGTLAGSGPAKCWGEVGTRTFRADVTASITGNGNYTFNITNGASETDGATLMIIYRDLSATYKGSLIINDGCIVNNSGGSVSQTMTGINACGASTAANAFVIASDLQPNAGPNHSTTLNGVTGTYPQNFWNFDVANTSVFAGQNNATFGVSTSSDCYAMAVMGLYFQTNSCGSCTPSSALSVTPTQSNVTCNGGSNGSATVSVTGGTAPYTYSWSPSGGNAATASGLAAGTYVCTITDASGCMTTTQSFTITQPAALTASQSQTNVSCNSGTNGTATVAPSGGTGAYTYSWSPSGGNAGTASSLAAGNYSCTITDANGCSIVRNFTITQPAVLSATQSQVNVSCNGGSNGSATVSPSGGTSAYTYAWSPSGGTSATATGLSAGAYSCQITDANGCTTTNNFTITQPAALTATQSQVDATCGGSNGTATVSPSGGTGAYTYLWSPSGGSAATASGLSPGAYSCNITDANGCSVTMNFTINTSTSVTATKSQTNVTCNGGSNGSATVIPSGGTGTYTYSWSPSGGTGATANGLSQGNYSCTITDATGCSIVESFTITEPTALSVTPSQTNVSCNGGNNGTATVALSGGTGAYTYSWSPSGGTSNTASGLSPGNYTCLITDANGCSVSQNFTISEPLALSSTQTQTNVSCFGGNNGTATVTASGGTPNYTYSWSPSGGNSATASNLSQGNYSCMITDQNGCQITTNFVISEPSELTATQSQTDVTCDGGNDGTATVAPAGGTGTYTYSWSASSSTSQTATGLSQGVITCTISDANGCSITKSFTLNANPPINIIPSQINVSCNGGNDGTATVTASGGTGTLTYSWSPINATTSSVSGLSQGNYTCTVSDALGCSIVQNFNITEPGAINISFNTTGSTCAASDGSATAVTTGGTGSYTYSWSTGGTGVTENNLAAGIYSLTVTDANGCTAISNVTINSNGPAILPQATQVDVSCNGGNNGIAIVNPAGGSAPYTFSWSTSTLNNDSLTGLTAGTYNVTISDANGCSASHSFTITEPVALTATHTQTDITCNGANNGSAVVTAGGGTGTYTYSWSPGPNTTNTGSGLGAGTHVVTVTDANGCTVTSTIQIAEPQQLTAVQLQADVSCSGGNNGSATVQVSGGTGSYTYSWTGSADIGATADTLVAGTYICTITDANNCSISETFNITEPAALALSMSSTDAGCTVNNGTATASVTGGTGSYTYSWSPTGGNLATASMLAGGTYICTITDQNGCTIIDSVVVNTMVSNVVVTATSSNLTCNASNDGSVSATVSGGTPSYTYSWLPSGGNGPNASNLSAGTYTVVVADINGCYATDTAVVTEPNAITGTTIVSGATCHNICNGKATVQASGGSGSYSYSWNPGGQTTNSVTSLCPGSYECTVTDANNCSTVITAIIQQLPTVDAVIQSTSNVLCNAGSDGAATVSVSGGLGGTYTYQWTPGAVNMPSVTNIPAGTYTVAVTDSIGCLDTAIAVIYEPLPVSVSVTGDTLVCASTNAQLNASVSGGTAPYSYLWSSGGNLSSETVTPTSSSQYNVQITDANGCQAQSALHRVDVPLPLTTVMSLADSICPGDESFISITASGGLGAYTYSWNNNGGTVNGPVTVSPVSSTTYVCTVSDGCQTLKLDSVTIHVYNNPEAAISVVKQAEIEQQIQFTSTGTGATEWLWNFGDGNTSTMENPTHQYFRDGEYNIHLEVTSAEGCKDTVTFSFVEVIQETGIPNVFSPNGDGQNDIFYIKSSKVSRFDLKVFDRWGIMVYGSDTEYVTWDGYSMAGIPLSDGTYYYVLKSHFKTGEVTDLTGFVTIVR